MSKEADLAMEIWVAIEADLSDRGCFNGIDDDTMAEIAEAQTSTIAGMLRKAART